MLAGLSGFNTATGALALVAAAMVALNLYILRHVTRDPAFPSFSTMVLAVALLLSQMVFWLGLAYYLETPSDGGFVAFALAAQFMMVPFGIWFVTLVFEESEHPIRPRTGWITAIVLLVFGNELFMSWTFAALTPGALPASIRTVGALGEAAVASLSSAWYFWPMGVSMLVLLRWSRLSRLDAQALAALTLTAFLAPWVIEVPLVGAVGMAAAMGAGLLVLWRAVTRRASSEGDLWRWAGVGGGFLAMSLSWIGSYLSPAGPFQYAPFALTMTVVMIGESHYLFGTLLRRAKVSGAVAPGRPASPAAVGPSAVPPDVTPRWEGSGTAVAEGTKGGSGSGVATIGR
ncbi:MAG: hypothetical protein QXG65_00410 [Thermoplasmata archaeon]